MTYDIFVNDKTPRGTKWTEGLWPDQLVEFIKGKVNLTLTPMLIGYFHKIHFAGEIVMSVEPNGSTDHDFFELDLHHLDKDTWKVTIEYMHYMRKHSIGVSEVSVDIVASLRRMIPYCLKYREEIDDSEKS